MCWFCIPHFRCPCLYQYTFVQECFENYFDIFHHVFDLLVNCLGGPVIDTCDGDWILSPVAEVWQLTPSLLITSFTQATGLLRLGPHNTTFSYWDFFCSAQSFCLHMSIIAVSQNTSTLAIHLNFLTTFLYNPTVKPVSFSGSSICLYGVHECQMIDSTNFSQVESGIYMSPKHEAILITNFLIAVWLMLLSPECWKIFVCLHKAKFFILFGLLSHSKGCSISATPNLTTLSLRFCWITDSLNAPAADVSEGSSFGYLVIGSWQLLAMMPEGRINPWPCLGR